MGCALFRCRDGTGMIRQCVADMKVTEIACGASAASGQEGERLNVWQESDIPEDFSGRIM